MAMDTDMYIQTAFGAAGTSDLFAPGSDTLAPEPPAANGQAQGSGSEIDASALAKKHAACDECRMFL